MKNDFVMIKGACPGPVKRILTLRKALRTHTSRAHLEKVQLKVCTHSCAFYTADSVIQYIDTTSKMGHGKYNTPEEKASFLGQMKIKAAA